MPRGIRDERYTGEFKQKVVETTRQEGLSYREAARQFAIKGHGRIEQWERIYLEEGVEGLYLERRGRANGSRKGRPPKLDKQIEEDLIRENQRLRAEVDYLKNLNALVSERVQREKKHRSSGN